MAQSDDIVTLVASRDTVWQGQRYTIEVRVEGRDVEQIDFELPEGVQVLSRTSGQQIGYEGGRRYIRMTKGYTILAEEAGTIIFGPATVEVGGVTHRAEATTVVVLPNADYQPPTEKSATNSTRKTYKLR